MKQGWEIKKLGEVCCKKQQIARAVKKHSLSDSIVYIDISAIDSSTNEIKEPTTMLLKDAPSRAQQVVEKNDILVSLVRPNLRNIALICDDSNNLVASSGFCVLRTKENPRFLKYIVLGKSFTNYLISKTSGANYPAVKEDDVKGYSIPIPPLAEQGKIVEELDCLSGIIEKKKQQLKEYDALAQSIFYEMFGNPIDNEKGWGYEKLSNKAEISSSKRIFANEYTECGIPFYRGKEVTEKSKGNPITVELFISQERYEEVKIKYGVPAIGDILVTAVGTIGNIWVVDSDEPFYFKDGNVLWLKIKDNTNPIYFKYILTILIDEYKEMMANGCAYSALTIANLKDMPTCITPLSLQQEFASKIEAIEKQKELLKQSIAETETLFNSRMDYYFN